MNEEQNHHEENMTMEANVALSEKSVRMGGVAVSKQGLKMD